ncbi:MAG: hypothetical protein P8Y92_13680 [Halioglobus sp.]|jgi:hypothetical protein
MAYFCRDCSYRGNTSGSNGECPACGSFNMVRGQRHEEAPPPARWRLVVLVLLWGWLFAMIVWKLAH